MSAPLLGIGDCEHLARIVERVCKARSLDARDRQRIEEAITCLLMLGSVAAASSSECVGDAVGSDAWWPTGSYWPEGVARDASVAGHLRALEALGWTLTNSAEREPYTERIALLTRAPLGDATRLERPPTLGHVMRQRHDGLWSFSITFLAELALPLETVRAALRCTGPVIYMRRWARPGRRCE